MQPYVELDQRLARAGDRHDPVAGAAEHGDHGIAAGRHVVDDHHGRVRLLAVAVHLRQSGTKHGWGGP
ncbi:hypothetical protein [Streptomyces dysideae]|uniref:hypothetical protein n=1 Tax=Streptomyces dysideae TaxID=909626 RepID=UPI000AFCB6CA|nr:hypothetical protein [Streptomyces dysideae]